MAYARSERMYYVYTYSYPDSGIPFYVGKGCGSRVYRHLRNAQKGRCDKNLIKFKIIQGILNSGSFPKIEKVLRNATEEEANAYEQKLISLYGRLDLGTGCLANMTDGGDGTRNVSIARRNQVSSQFSGSKNHNFKKPLSIEVKEKISQSLLGRRLPVEVREKMSRLRTGKGNTFYGKTHSLESREKIRQANIRYNQAGLRKPASEETRRKLSASNKGKNLGRKHTEETRRKYSEQRKGNTYARGTVWTNEQKMKLRVERTCPHCGVSGRGSAMVRHHMDNCTRKASLKT